MGAVPIHDTLIANGSGEMLLARPPHPGVSAVSAVCSAAPEMSLLRVKSAGLVSTKQPPALIAGPKAKKERSVSLLEVDDPPNGLDVFPLRSTVRNNSV